MKHNKSKKSKVNYDELYHNSIISTNTLQQEFQNFPAWGMGRPHYINGHTVFTPCLNYPPLFYSNIATLLDRTIVVLPYKFWEVAK